MQTICFAIGLSANPTESQLYNKIFDMMTGSLRFGYIGGDKLKGKANNPTDPVIDATILAFSRYILTTL